jgi:hypothetical protein
MTEPPNLREANSCKLCMYYQHSHTMWCDKHDYVTEKHEICDDYSPEGEGDGK